MKESKTKFFTYKFGYQLFYSLNFYTTIILTTNNQIDTLTTF